METISVPITATWKNQVYEPLGNFMAVKELVSLSVSATGSVDQYIFTIEITGMSTYSLDTIATIKYNRSLTPTITYASGFNPKNFNYSELYYSVIQTSGSSYYTGTITFTFNYYDQNYYTWTGTASVSSGATNVTVTSNSYFPSEWIEYIDKFMLSVTPTPSASVPFNVYVGDENIGWGAFISGLDTSGTSIENGSDNLEARKCLHDTNTIIIRAFQGQYSFPAGTMTVTVDYKKSKLNHARTFNQYGKLEWNTVWYYNGSAFVRCDPKYYDGTAWRNCI